MINNYYCVIMAGGSGTRFWPICRNARPKQFLEITGTGKSFLRHTYDRFAKFFPKENILLVTTGKYAGLAREQVPEILPENLLVEPYGRDTAPCITYATYTLLKRNPDAVMVVSPADHIILDEDMFRSNIMSAMDYAEKKSVLMTLGTVPTRPDTNYGYIQVQGGKNACFRDEAAPVKTFTEKPDAALAKVFVDSGEFLWNSGIFVWRADTIREELEKHLPEVSGLFKGWENALGSPLEEQFVESAYSDCIRMSIDYGVMEKTDRAWIFPAKFGWTDIGAWGSLYSFFPDKDEEGNAFFAGKTLSEDNRNLLAISSNRKKLLAVRGMEDFIIIDTDDVLLICPKDDRKLKDFIAGIAMPGYEEYR